MGFVAFAVQADRLRSDLRVTRKIGCAPLGRQVFS